MAKKKIRVFGLSDDLIEVDGAIEEEFGGGDEPRYVHVNDGTVLKVWYGAPKDGGIWSVTVVKLGEGTMAEHVECSDEDADPYSDVVTLIGEFSRVECFDTAEGPSEAEMRDALRDFDWGLATPEKLRAVFAVVREVL